MDPAWIVDPETGRAYPAIRGGTGAETVAVIAVVAAAASAAVGTYAAVEQGRTAKAVSDYNRKVAENQAEMARQAAAEREEAHRDQVRRLIARQVATYGASGVDVAEGSPLLVASETAKQGALDALRIRYGGEAQATGYESQAGLDEYLGRRQAQAAYTQAGATLLSGATSAAGTYYRTRPPTTTVS